MLVGANAATKDGGHRSFALASDDLGRSWFRAGLVPLGRGPDGAIINGTECQVAQSGSGTIYMSIRDLHYGHIVTSSSTDGGDSFRAMTLATAIQAPDCEGSLIGLPPRTTGGPDTLAMSHPHCTDISCAAVPIYARRFNMSLDISSRGLSTWQKPTTLLHIGSSGYSSLVQLNASHLGVLFSCGQKGSTFAGGPRTYDQSVVFVAVALDASLRGAPAPLPWWITGCNDSWRLEL